MFKVNYGNSILNKLTTMTPALRENIQLFKHETVNTFIHNRMSLMLTLSLIISPSTLKPNPLDKNLFKTSYEDIRKTPIPVVLVSLNLLCIML